MTAEIESVRAVKGMSALRTALESIVADCKEWNSQHRTYHPHEAERRRTLAFRGREALRALFGLFVYPRFKGVDSIYLFEGLRNKEYMGTFNKQAVFVVGSHEERSFARDRGYGFVWSFPVEVAVRATVYRGRNLLTYVQLMMWRRALRGKGNVVFFLYEDTQPLGTFLVHLARCVLTNAKSVCVQHGYFTVMKESLRYEGLRSEINFVWDDRQAELMGLDPSRTFRIGLPYAARAKDIGRLSVVLVGVGAPYGDPQLFRSALDAFQAIAMTAERELGLEVTYRPHPNERVHPEVLSLLEATFPSVDSLSKVERLNGPRSIFVGTVSSLMYEAKQAGHFVVCLQIQDREIPVFDCDLVLQPQGLSKFATWARKLMDNPGVSAEAGPAAAADAHLVRFRNAVVEAKLPPC